MIIEYGTFVTKDDMVISEASCHGLKENSRGLIQKKLYLLYYKKYNQKSENIKNIEINSEKKENEKRRF